MASLSESNGNEIEDPVEKTAMPCIGASTSSDSKDEKDQTDGNGQQNTPKLSKNALKRLRKLERNKESKRRRKEEKKNRRLAKAKAEGRDIEAERKEMEERTQDGTGRARRKARRKEDFDKNHSKFQICIDCSFESLMLEKEVNSLASQIRYCYAQNKRAKHPVQVQITDCTGTTLDHLKNVAGFDSWHHRAFGSSDKGLLETYPDKSKLVYLTSDSKNVLEKLEDDKVYIIGGIVDRNRLKRVAIDRAEKLGIATAKLPIADYLSMTSTKVLTCNHVFEILIKFREVGYDWMKAFLSVLPNRKEAKEKDGPGPKETDQV